MSDLIVNLNVNKKSDKRPEMGNSFGAYTDPNGLHAKSILKPDVYTHPYDLNSIKNRTLSATKSEMESKGLRSEKHLSNVTLINNVDHKRMVTEAALQAASLQAITAWAELCWRIKRAYRIAAQEMTDLSLADELGAYAKKLGETLWRDDWQQLLLKLQVLLREMAVEQRERLRRAANTQATTKPDEYIKALLQGHKAFCAAGDALAPVLPSQVDKLLAKRFAPADFKLLNSRMFESCVYSDPVIQDSVPAAIGRVAGNDRQLVRSYLALDEQMTDVASRWLDVKKLILKLGKGRAQLLDDWKACKELREIASETNWRIRKKPPTISSLPDFDVQLMTLADELSTDRSCACSADTLPDTPPLSPDQPDLLKLVSKTSKLLSPVRTNQKRPQDKKPTTNTNTTTTTKGKISTNQSQQNQQVNKENQVPKNVNTKTGIVNLNGGVVPQQKCDHNKKEIQQPIKKKVEEKCMEKTHCEQPKSQSGSGAAPNLGHKKSGTCQCECPHGEEDPRQINKFNKLRDRLRTRLKEKEKQKTTTKMEGSSSTEKSNDDRDIAQLLNFIEGTDTLDPIKAQKNAARKLRRQERKLEAERQRIEEERRKEEEERQRVEQERLRLEQEALAKAAEAKAQARLAKKEKNENENGKKPGPMVTIKRVMQGSNKEPTVTITLKGSTPDKDKLLFTLINGQTENKPSTEANKVDLSQLNPSQLSKKQRKKLKKEQAKNAQQQQQQQQAIQNQMKIENKVEKENNNNNNNKSSNKKTKSNNSNNKPAVSNNSKQSSGSDNPKATSDKGKSNGNGNGSAKEVPNVNSNSNSNSNSNNSSVKVSLNNKSDSSVLNLQMLKLPPGITITKVEGPSADRKIQLNAKTASSNNSNTNANSNNSNSSTPPPIQQSPAPVQSSDNRSGIIVVDTVKLKQDLPSSAENSSQRSKKNKKKKNKKQKDPEKSQEKNEDEVVKITNTNTSDGSNMFTLKNPMFYPAMNETQEKQGINNTHASIIKGANGMVTIRSPRLGACNGSGAIPFMSLQAVASGDVKPSHILGELKPVVQAQNTAQPTPMNTSNSAAENKPFDAQQILSGLPGIEITKINKGSAKPRNEKAAFQPADVSIIPTNMASNGDVYKLFYDNADWSLESVFAPKDIKEDEILDADELELEAFKRFCQQSVPPERKEKVAYLNVKDIILKKKASEKC